MRFRPGAGPYCPNDGARLFDPVTRGPLGIGGPEPGEVIGDYRFLEVIGEGGMGVVYRGEHVGLGRPVALKVLRRGFSLHPEVTRRFFDEARAASEVGHDNVVEIFDFVDDERARFFVMELLVGFPLSALTADGPLPLARVWHIGVQIADALIAVHDASIVHRDIKPANIFLVQRGLRFDHVKLLDFGVAKRAGRALVDTETGARVGTPIYMSPEQLRGEPARVESDVYAFGLLLYRMLTGRRAFDGPAEAMVVKKEAGRLVPPNSYGDLPHVVPADLVRLIGDCLRPDPNERPASMRDVQAFLADACQGRVESTQLLLPTKIQSRSDVTPPTGVEVTSVERHSRKRRMRAAGLLLVGTLFGLVVGGGLAFHNMPREVPVEVERKEVEILLDSSPRGATVRTDADKVIGKTPIKLTLPRTGAVHSFRFSHKRYKDAVVSVSDDENQRVLTVLSRTRRRR